LEEELELGVGALRAWRLEEELQLGGELPKFGAWSRSRTHVRPR